VTDGRAAIEAAIPHREPFLFLDRIVEHGEHGLSAEWVVPAEASWFRGHYPGNPVLPGAILCEHVFQAAAVFVSQRLGGFSAADGVPVLTRIEGARFRRMVRPGERLITGVELVERLGPAWYMLGRTRRGAELVAEVRFVLAATAALARADAETRAP
jgi:3-hydroxyacyl-[acyl-carrier-protein] dehydratase